MKRERGFALLLVLWTLVLLALVATEITASGHSEAQLALNLRRNAAADALAEGAVYEAVFHLIDQSASAWQADGRDRTIRMGRAVAIVHVENLSGRINPNLATPDVLAALLADLGVPPRNADTLANAIADWRTPVDDTQPVGTRDRLYRAAGLTYTPPGSQFQSVDELGYVIGMTPDLLARLRPHLSVYTVGDPDRMFADPIVAHVMQVLNMNADDAFSEADRRANLAVQIVARVTLPEGGAASRTAVVRIGERINGRRYRILAWEATHA